MTPPTRINAAQESNCVDGLIHVAEIPMLSIFCKDAIGMFSTMHRSHFANVFCQYHISMQKEAINTSDETFVSTDYKCYYWSQNGHMSDGWNV